MNVNPLSQINPRALKRPDFKCTSKRCQYGQKREPWREWLRDFDGVARAGRLRWRICGARQTAEAQPVAAHSPPSSAAGGAASR